MAEGWKKSLILRQTKGNYSAITDETLIQFHDDFKVINDDLLKLSIYGTQWLITFNALKTEYNIVSKRQTCAMHPDLFLNDTKLTEVNNHKHLG